MGMPGRPWYGDTDLGSAVEDVETIVKKIKTNKFGKKDIISLHNAVADLLAVILADEYED